MKLQKSFSLKSKPADLSERIQQAFQKAGFNQTQSSPLLFERGSIIGSFASFSPSSWKAKVVVQIEELSSGVSMRLAFNVNTVGQITTSKERAFWDSEANSIASMIAGESIELKPTQEIAQQSFWENISYFGGSIALAWLGSSIAPQLSDNSSASTIGAVAGLFVGLAITAKRLNFWKS